MPPLWQQFLRRLKEVGDGSATHPTRKPPLNWSEAVFRIGVADGTRTRDSQDHNLVLYQLNYSHHRRNFAVREV